uniref:Uncharacterized protein n=1 Tax=Eutreptiella gymnastica TaxID=73025 RepID=A0A7S1I590_9EUGL
MAAETCDADRFHGLSSLIHTVEAVTFHNQRPINCLIAVLPQGGPFRPPKCEDPWGEWGMGNANESVFILPPWQVMSRPCTLWVPMPPHLCKSFPAAVAHTLTAE